MTEFGMQLRSANDWVPGQPSVPSAHHDWEVDNSFANSSCVYSRTLLLKVEQILRHTSERGQSLINQASWFNDETSDNQTRHSLFDGAGDGVLRAMEMTPDATTRNACQRTPPKPAEPMPALRPKAQAPEKLQAPCLPPSMPPPPPPEVMVADGTGLGDACYTDEHSDSEYGQLLCLLGMSPNGVMSYEHLLEYAPEPLSYLLQDTASFWWWLQNNNDGSIEVFGHAGTGHVALRLAPLIPPPPVPDSPVRNSEEPDPVFSYGPNGSPMRTVGQAPFKEPLTDSSHATDFKEWTTFNPDAAEFKISFNPEAAEFKPSVHTVDQVMLGSYADLGCTGNSDTLKFADAILAYGPHGSPQKRNDKIAEFTPLVPPPPNLSSDLFAAEAVHGVAPDLSDEEQAKLLGTQLVFDIGGFGSPESARTSAGTEQETGEDETEEEDRGAAAAAMAAAVAVLSDA